MGSGVGRAGLRAADVRGVCRALLVGFDGSNAALTLDEQALERLYGPQAAYERVYHMFGRSPMVASLRMRRLPNSAFLWRVLDAIRSTGLLPKLRALDLSCNRLGEAGAVALAPALLGMPLESLDLRCNNLGAAGTATLAAALKSMSRLKWLNLSDNGVCTAAIAFTLKGVTSLESLDLSFNNLGANELAPALKGMTRLKSLDLRGNCIGASTAAALAPVLVGMTLLESLRLGQNHLAPAGAAALAPALKEMTS